MSRVPSLVAGALIASTVLTAAAQSRKPLLGTDGSGPSEIRCGEIDVTLSRIAPQILDVAQQLRRSSDRERIRLEMQLSSLLQQQRLLETERIGCVNSGPFTGSSSSLPGAPVVSDGRANQPEALPGAPAPAASSATGSAATLGTRATLADIPTGAVSPIVPTDGLTPEQRTAICADKFRMSAQFRREAPALRAEIATLEGEQSALGTPAQRRGQVSMELQSKRERQIYVANQISILEESMAGITGCDLASGRIVAVVPPPAEAPKVPAGLAGTSRQPDRTPAPSPEISATPLPPSRPVPVASPAAPSSGSGAAAGKPCDSVTFSKIAGDWKSNNGPTRFSGPCDNITGTFTYQDSPLSVPRSQWKTQTGVMYEGSIVNGNFKFKYRLPFITGDVSGTGGCTMTMLEPLTERSSHGVPVGDIQFACSVSGDPYRIWLFWRTP